MARLYRFYLCALCAVFLIIFSAFIAAADLLKEIQKDTFAPLLHSTFMLQQGDHSVKMELIEITDRSTETLENFSFIFSGPVNVVLNQGLHTMSHQKLGAFSLFLVPVGKTDKGRIYEAAFSRPRNRAGPG